MKDVLEQIEKIGSRAFTLKEMARALEASTPHDRNEIKLELNRLVNEGFLVVTKDGYIKASEAGIVKGIIQGNKRGYGFLIREDGKEDLFIPPESMCGARHKDTVLVKTTYGDRAEVVKILSRGITQTVGTFHITRGGGFGFVTPDDDNYFGDIFVSQIDGFKDGSKVVVEITSFDDINPSGKISETLGKAGTVTAETVSILRMNGFSEKFPEGLEDKAGMLLNNKDMASSREDFRSLLTITIDGEDAKDFDDAISLVKTDKGYTLYVHIADVSSFVPLNSEVDEEAFKRGTSVYFPGKAYPMLPSVLSDNLCSLLPREDRRVLSVVMDIDESGKVVTSRVSEGIINSFERMTYTNVNAILKGDKALRERYASIVEMLDYMKELAEKRSKIRAERGAINFDNTEAQIVLDEKGQPVGLAPYPYDIGNAIIEEFMLLANECVAEYVYYMGYPFVYRIHEKPLDNKLSSLRVFLKSFGIAINTKEIYAGQFSEILDKVKNEPYRVIVNKVMLRSMCKAKYSFEHSEHFGLAARFYCHFTSPIRRYPDLTIHRIIKDIINGRMTDEKIETYRELTQNVAINSTERERAADTAERDVDDFYKALYMKDHIGEKYDGVISGLNSYYLYVELPNTVEGKIAVEDLDGFGYVFNETEYTLSNGTVTYRLGDGLKIEVKGANEFTREVYFALQDSKSHKAVEIKRFTVGKEGAKGDPIKPKTRDDLKAKTYSGAKRNSASFVKSKKASSGKRVGSYGKKKAK